MDGFWAERSLKRERMDVETLDAPTAASILGTLETINAWIGGVHATLSHLRAFSKNWKPGERIRLIDWGTGGADLPRALVRWGRQNGFQLEITGVDNNGPILEVARRACRDYPEIQLIHINFNNVGDGVEFLRFFSKVNNSSTSPEPFDYALSSLCLHHLKDEEIVTLLKTSDQITTRGMIMNDLKRSVRAWLWIWTLTRLGGVHPIVQNDAPLSVRRSFRARELEKLAERAGLSYLKVKTHFGYRLSLAGEKRRGRRGDTVTGGRNDGVRGRRGDGAIASSCRFSPSPPHPVPPSDVVVIGGGPAGSAAGIRLKRLGLTVRLYEKARFPRPKLCGGFLSPESLIDLEELGVLSALKEAGALPIRRTVISSPSGRVVEAPLPSAGLSLAREKLDRILLQQARESGVDVCEGTDGRGHEHEAPWTIETAGRNGPDSLQGPRYYGLQAFFDNVDGISDQVELDIVQTGYVGLVRQNAYQTNVCALVSRQLFESSGASPDAAVTLWKKQNPLLDQRLRNARRVSGWQAIGPVRMGLRRLTASQILYAGDAACVVDPFAGEGMAMALRSAALMQRAFQTSGEQTELVYERLWHRTFDAPLRFHRWTRVAMNTRMLHEPILTGLQIFPSALTWLTERTRPPLYAPS
jgi:flavin-dependent dehydrogenase